ncbi:NAD(P)-dependent oxidoreductase [Salinarimonas soli]|uniref:NAD(P)-dependent oxidoreductase n=1 Tax=Salinarimonas soli TaxID=1638099 RepID=A0A5B2VBC6_9HYPH|nr:NAD(P)-dependent oxidoreductase [Salinarimonas soli]KAA2235629.1 NAD(P)-dependent oxidoreductase [Salinarimonas soli]
MRAEHHADPGKENIMRKAAVLGLGIIGTGLVRNLVRSGHEVTVWNRSERTLPREVGAARRAPTIRDAVAGQDRVLVCLTGPDAQREVYWGENGVLASVAPGTIVADVTTTDPGVSREVAEAMAERGASALDAPVFGSRNEAWEGQLDFCCGGSREAFTAMKPTLEPLAATIHYMGDHGSGSAMKLVGNLLVAAQMASLGEALSLAQKAGLQSEAVMGVLEVTDYSSALIRGVGKASLARDFAPNFYLRHMLKDARLIRDFARDESVPLPVTSVIEALYQAALNAGLGDLNASALHEMMFAQAGLGSKKQ